MTELPPRLFVTGTDTGVGKTVVAAALAAADPGPVRALKPVATGCPAGAVPQDADLLARGAGHEPLWGWSWVPPVSPHRAAELAPPAPGLDEVVGWIREHQGPRTLVEGVGGWRVPVDWGWGVRELASALGWPVLVVAADRLGVLNHALLTVDAVRGCGLEVAGVVLNRPGPAESEHAAARRWNHDDLLRLLPGVPVRVLEPLPRLTRAALRSAGRGLLRA